MNGTIIDERRTYMNEMDGREVTVLSEKFIVDVMWLRVLIFGCECDASDDGEKIDLMVDKDEFLE